MQHDLSTKVVPWKSWQRRAVRCGRRHSSEATKRTQWSLLLLVLLLACSPSASMQVATRNLATDEQETMATSAVSLGSSEASSTSSLSVADSTIMFLHVFKCAGTSLREVFTMLAEKEGWTGAIVEECRGDIKKLKKRAVQLLPAYRICLDTKNDLIHTKSQTQMVKATKVLAGHFLWDFRQYAKPPHLLITTLRNPLELFVSSQQFKHREETADLKSAADYVATKMKSRLTWEDPTDIGFIRRFLGTDAANTYVTKAVYSEAESLAMVDTAIENLNTFWVVGVVEQYRGFVEVLKHSLDPELKHGGLWKRAVDVKNNGSPIRSSDVLQSIDQDLVREFNSTTLSYQWMVYTEVLQLWDAKCREVLPVGDHNELCSVRHS